METGSFVGLYTLKTKSPDRFRSGLQNHFDFSRLYELQA
ncbi:hypothetical protein HAPS_0616 [Glaesserella parasuis SH0165]|uniref:Uncharacterized protein n=1 Tax=Glaesserella parasuis serovar 5 (strain SH0165) TaxID=557723 RepID=B8F4L7_GLAP5|nr:hypothetical protein HAPS_0616 [Glaesserella parasuis SH0165]